MTVPRTKRIPEITGPLAEDSYFSQMVRVLRNNFSSLENCLDDQVNEFFNTTISTTPYTINEVKPVFLCDSTVGDITVNLPATGKYRNKFLYIKKIVSANSVILTPQGIETIDLDPTFTLTTFDAVKLYSDGSNWWII